MDTYNLVMYILYQHVYLTENPIHKELVNVFSSGNFLESYNHLVTANKEESAVF